MGISYCSPLEKSSQATCKSLWKSLPVRVKEIQVILKRDDIFCKR